MYILEGNIGVGKSTFLTLIKKHLSHIEVLTEPVNDWSKQQYGQSLLEDFYKNTSRWAYTLETLTMICRSKDHMREQQNPNPNRILERSIYSGHYCFAQNCFKTGHMNRVEWSIYNEWAQFLLHKRCNPPHGFIYLKATPETCMKRTLKRNRESEKSLTLEYLQQIDVWHDRFLVEKKDVSIQIANTPVLVLDCNEEFLENEQNMRSHASKVEAFVAQTQKVQVAHINAEQTRTPR